MLKIFIITILIILLCIFIMSLGYILSGKTISSTCGNYKDNPCECTISERIKCAFKKQ